MATEAKDSAAVVDPLVNCWGLSLFPHSSGVLPDASKSYNPDFDLDSIHNHLISMALRSPDKLLEQAKSIMNGNPGLFNSEVLGDSAASMINGVVSEEVEENQRQRRPGLGRKRARFSMIPQKIDPLNTDDLKRKEALFMAHERLENAKRDIQKQMGNASFEPNQETAPTGARQRRPGLLGNNQRRSVKYRHLYDVPSFQETAESGGLNPAGESPEKVEAHFALPRNELAESSAVKDSNLSNILNELLHSTEELEQDQAITLLQERLQIKPIVIEELSIPDYLPNNRVTEFKTFGGNLPKPRKPLRNIDNMLKEIKSVTPLKLRQDAQSPLLQLTSPTPPRSPFALLPSLQKRISQSRPSVNSFSTLDFDDLSPRNSSQIDMTTQGLNLADHGKTSDKLNEPLVKDINSLDEETMRNFITTENSEDGNSRKPAPGTNIDSNQSDVDMVVDVEASDVNTIMDDIISRENYGANEPCKSKNDIVSTFAGTSKEDNSTEPALGTNIDSNISHVDMEVDIGGIGVDNQIGHDKISSENEPNKFGDKVPEVVASEQTVDPDVNFVNPLDQSNCADGKTRTIDDGSEQCLQENSGNSKVQRKVKSRKHRDTQLSIFPGAGTSWDAGVRRSTRNRSRPLEYWKGERPIYGLVHGSSATWIGVKVLSPGTADGKPTMKVKSFVDKKYKGLLDLASQY